MCCCCFYYSCGVVGVVEATRTVRSQYTAHMGQKGIQMNDMC